MPRILIIEDEELTRQTVRQTLEMAGYTVMEADNGRKGVRLFREQPADLIITDIVMPEQEGLETIRELKRDFPDVKILAASGGGAMNPDDYLSMAKKFGATRILQKPFELTELLKIVREMLDEG